MRTRHDTLPGAVWACRAPLSRAKPRKTAARCRHVEVDRLSIRCSCWDMHHLQTKCGTTRVALAEREEAQSSGALRPPTKARRKSRRSTNANSKRKFRRNCCKFPVFTPNLDWHSPPLPPDRHRRRQRCLNLSKVTPADLPQKNIRCYLFLWPGYPDLPCASNTRSGATQRLLGEQPEHDDEALRHVVPKKRLSACTRAAAALQVVSFDMFV